MHDYLPVAAMFGGAAAVTLLYRDAVKRSKSLSKVIRLVDLAPALLSYAVAFDPDDLVACVAAFHLKQLGKKRSLSALISLLQLDLCPPRYYCCLSATRHWKDKELLPILKGSVDDKCYPVKVLSLELLSRYPDEVPYVLGQAARLRATIEQEVAICSPGQFASSPMFYSTRDAQTYIDRIVASTGVS